MNNSTQKTETGLNHKQFYKELGHLLYAISSTDGQVQEQEAAVLKDFILKELSPEEPSSDSSGMNKAFYAQFEFFDFTQKNINSSEAFDSFIGYLRKNKTLVDKSLKKIIIKAVEKVAAAFNKTSKEEKEMIDKLKKEIISIN